MDAPRLKPLPLTSRWSRRHWLFTKDWRIEVPIYGNIVIPVATVTDGATVPRALWSLYSPTGVLFLPSLVHDYAIARGHLLLDNEDRDRVCLENWEADQLFLLLCFREDLNYPASYLAYAGVRLGTKFRGKKNGKTYE